MSQPKMMPATSSWCSVASARMTRGGADGRQGMGDVLRWDPGSAAHFSLRMQVDISGARGWRHMAVVRMPAMMVAVRRIDGDVQRQWW